ncbi:hypothetical protein TNCV_4662971 [Trichonephila clavipes]|uniref:Uncharacterized protein n=1 Tax=Trichonephila clavipes TaxID=2585209 RepID=A0A8X6SBD0_TRICX|nr:hypothetical protein TNCV_4662971 [Trichonephila clavipes]
MIAKCTDWRRHQLGIHLVKRLRADDRHPFWHGRRVAWSRQQPGQASGGILPKSHTPKGSWGLGYGSTFVNARGNNALCSSEGQGDFRLRRLGSLIGILVGCLIAGDLNMTGDSPKGHSPSIRD